MARVLPVRGKPLRSALQGLRAVGLRRRTEEGGILCPRANRSRSRTQRWGTPLPEGRPISPPSRSDPVLSFDRGKPPSSAIPCAKPWRVSAADGGRRREDHSGRLRAVLPGPSHLPGCVSAPDPSRSPNLGRNRSLLFTSLYAYSDHLQGKSPLCLLQRTKRIVGHEEPFLEDGSIRTMLREPGRPRWSRPYPFFGVRGDLATETGGESRSQQGAEERGAWCRSSRARQTTKMDKACSTAGAPKARPSRTAALPRCSNGPRIGRPRPRNDARGDLRSPTRRKNLARRNPDRETRGRDGRAAPRGRPRSSAPW